MCGFAINREPDSIVLPDSTAYHGGAPSLNDIGP